jgi:hypothetical protein
VPNIVILDQTCFYPLGGGQDNDTGALKINGEMYDVVRACRPCGFRCDADSGAGERAQGGPVRAACAGPSAARPPRRRRYGSCLSASLLLHL